MTQQQEAVIEEIRSTFRRFPVVAGIGKRFEEAFPENPRSGYLESHGWQFVGAPFDGWLDPMQPGLPAVPFTQAVEIQRSRVRA